LPGNDDYPKQRGRHESYAGLLDVYLDLVGPRDRHPMTGGLQPTAGRLDQWVFAKNLRRHCESPVLGSIIRWANKENRHG
jgi:hypothetical protein